MVACQTVVLQTRVRIRCLPSSQLLANLLVGCHLGLALASVRGNRRKYYSNVQYLLFPTRFLTSEDEYKWYWHQIIYFPETINTVSTRI
jgi:hypothetical protein